MQAKMLCQNGRLRVSHQDPQRSGVISHGAINSGKNTPETLDIIEIYFCTYYNTYRYCKYIRVPRTFICDMCCYLNQ